MDKIVLIVEDEVAIRSMTRYALENASFKVLEAGDVVQAEVILAGDVQPDLILLDWMLPHTTGAEFTKKLRLSSAFKHYPIIMLTAKAEEENKITALEAGADDYVVKPFSTSELIARIKAVLRRGPAVELDDELELGGIVLDAKSHRVVINGQQVKMGRLEFRMLYYFMKNPERVFTRDQLLNKVWGTDKYIDDRTVDVHIRRLRRRLAPYDKKHVVQTVHGSGYRFSEQVDG